MTLRVHRCDSVKNAGETPAVRKLNSRERHVNGAIKPSSIAGHGMPCPY